ncbi:MEDS domain-containing protein [Streptomyces sp. NPDC086989]|uniref:MEDS domain-containing protein n=1 Tax=Streptomyces sp. NPDC086989 TaxID=3365764 RepID=UPI0038304618
MDVGDHVCWLVDGAVPFPGTARAYVADGALYGDKIVVVGAADGVAEDTFGVSAAVVLDLPLGDADSVLAAVRREARTAAREGYRSVRVLAERMPVTEPGAAHDLLSQELRLDEFASECGAMVVCAFRPSQWQADTLEYVASVHPHEMGTRAERPAFRMFSTGVDSWSVDGVIDSQDAAAFNAALRAAVGHTPRMRLCFDRLEMIDAAGMGALVEAANHLPGRHIVVEGANETVRLCWELAGYAAPGVPVVMAV